MNNREEKSQWKMTLVLTALAGVLFGLLISPGSKKKTVNLTKLDEAMGLIERYYVEKTNNDTLTDQMLVAMLSTLDPHSRYLSQKQLQREEESLQGGFDGIGVLLHYQGDTACVNQVIPGGPAEKVGLRTGDRLLQVDTTRIAGVGMKPEDVVKNLRGPHHSRAVLTVKRPGVEGQRHYTLIRNRISTPSVSYSGMLDETTGYIRLTRFCETSADEFRTALKQLQKQGMTKLIFDLRDNGGGLLQAAHEIASELLSNNELIVYTRGENQKKTELRSHRGGLFTQGTLVVMIDEYSASASEIIAGAVQDNDRGTIVGRRSFGKGLVQRQFSLTDGSAIWLTTARYYTPSGRCIQRPYDKGTDEYYSDFLNQLTQNVMADTVLSQVNDTTPYYTKKGRKVYGGGGIYPDHHLKLFTDSLLLYYNRLISERIFEQYSFDYATQHYEQLRKDYPTENDFVTKFQVTNAMFEHLLTYADKKNIKRNAKGIEKYTNDIKLHIKAEIAQSLFTSPTFYRVMIERDNEVQETLNMIRKQK